MRAFEVFQLLKKLSLKSTLILDRPKNGVKPGGFPTQYANY